MVNEFIRSADNARLKKVRALLSQSKIRHAEKQFVLEGVRLIQDSFKAGAHLEYVLYRAQEKSVESPGFALLNHMTGSGIPCLAVEPKLFDNLSDTQTSQGMIAVSAFPNVDFPAVLTLLLILDNIADPGNLGTILRTAAAAGVDGVILTPETVDLFNPKVVRSAMGAHFHIPARTENREKLQQLALPLAIAESRAKKSIYEVNWDVPLALAIGSEAHGIGPDLAARAQLKVSIPMVKGESLNAAVAAGVFLYEIYRQRHF